MRSRDARYDHPKGVRRVGSALGVPPRWHLAQGRASMRAAIYARVSTSDQEAASQIARLREWAARMGHQVAFERTDVASGKHSVRPGMEAVMAEARGHPVQIRAVAKVDRWARSIQHLASSVHELYELGVEFVAVDQGLRVSRDRTDPTSTLILHVLGAVAQWEESIISERTKEGLRHARAGGKRLGRPPKTTVSQPPSAPDAAPTRAPEPTFS